MSTTRRTKTETRELLLRAIEFLKRQSAAGKVRFTLREVARQAEVSHTLVVLEHPDIAALVKVTKDEISNEKERKLKGASGRERTAVDDLRGELADLKALNVRYAKANHSLDMTNQELRAQIAELEREVNAWRAGRMGKVQELRT